jgi:hypothetical protein
MASDRRIRFPVQTESDLLKGSSPALQLVAEVRHLLRIVSCSFTPDCEEFGDSGDPAFAKQVHNSIRIVAGLCDVVERAAGKPE